MARHLLVPMDDSEPSRAALEYALSQFPADDVTALHAVDDLEAGYAGRPTAEGAEPDVFDAAERDATIETVVREGRATEAILEYVREAAVDQVIVGSTGRSGVSRVLLGSVAERVARRSPVPVTIVR